MTVFIVLFSVFAISLNGVAVYIPANISHEP
ncbi:hypothetical protein DSM110093_03965 (plasmid) [Sulfitobacter sp. DSM 110093]|nr:hypothetical protein DSM110093_03965 [Sulfitobacter sp. DSM 110093]